MSTSDFAKPMPAGAEKKFQGKIFSVWQWDQELYDGSTAVFERIARPDYAYAVGVLPDKRIMLVHDEQPDREAVITAAGGKVEKGETPEAAAVREFKEETGYTVGSLSAWFQYQPSTKMDMRIHAFIAHDIKEEAPAELEPGERISLLFYSFDEFMALGENPMLRDWMLKIILLEGLLHKDKKEDIRSIIYAP